MAGLTLAEARTKVRQHLDDEKSRRWTDAQLDSALGSNLSMCLTEYVSEGGDRFDESTTLTTSATDGSASASALDPLTIKDVAVSTGQSFFRIAPARFPERELDDKTARSIVVLYVREYTLPTNAAHPLIGVGAAAANSWLAFDNWVCASAAIELGVKDNELRQVLQITRQEFRRVALLRVRVPKGRDWPMPMGFSTYFLGDLRWGYQPGTKTLRLMFTAGGVP